MRGDLFFQNVEKIKTLVGGFISEYLVWFQGVSIVISGLFLWGIVYILAKVNYFKIKKEQMVDVLNSGKREDRNLVRIRAVKEWKQIQQQFLSDSPEDRKQALIRCDRLLNEILKMSGYEGTDLSAKLQALTSDQLSSLERVRTAHILVDQLARNLKGEVQQEESVTAMRAYRDVFRELNLFKE